MSTGVQIREQLVRGLNAAACENWNEALDHWCDALRQDHTDPLLPYLVASARGATDDLPGLLEAYARVELKKPQSLICEYRPTEGWLPAEAFPAWVSRGTGDARIVAGALTIAALGASWLVYELSLPPAKESAIVTDAVVRRQSGSDGDCCLTLDNGVGREVLAINAGQAMLQSSGQTFRLNTSAFHVYRLVLHGARSVLFIDGLRCLESRSLLPSHTPVIRFGAEPTQATADTESQWALLRAWQNMGEPWEPVPRARQLAVAEMHLTSGRAERAIDLLGPLLGEVNSDVDSAGPVHKLLAELGALTTLSQRRVARLLSTATPEQRKTFYRTRTQRATGELILETVDVGVKFSRHRRPRTLKELYLRVFEAGRHHQDDHEWWALKGITLQVNSGDILGLIGPNGAGKSTFLRIIAGILQPDQGTVRLRGHPILLSPGLGFKDELSGRDNIYVGGVVLGMTRREIRKKFDEIVDFAELRNDIDRPFRYYSDGMKARLAFSVATSVETELLLLDELLSSGDIAFAEKAATRMHDLIRSARTIIIATHNMDFVHEYCTKALYVNRGQVRYFGNPDAAARLYTKDMNLE